MLLDLAAGTGGASSPRYLRLLERRLHPQVPILRGWLPRDADNNTARQAGLDGPPIFKHSLTSRTDSRHVSKPTSKTYRISQSFGRVCISCVTCIEADRAGSREISFFFYISSLGSLTLPRFNPVFAFRTLARQDPPIPFTKRCEPPTFDGFPFTLSTPAVPSQAARPECRLWTEPLFWLSRLVALYLISNHLGDVDVDCDRPATLPPPTHGGFVFFRLAVPATYANSTTNTFVWRRQTIICRLLLL